MLFPQLEERVRFHGGDNSDLMTIQEALDLASLLRRKDFVAQNDT